MAQIVVAHGAWSAGWAWKKMRPRMAAQGHALWTPTYTGIGERAHLAHRGVTLETHVEDLVRVIETEDLRGFVLLGHSYGGMVATAVADRLADRVAQLAYLDAFVPTDGKCLLDYVGDEGRARMLAAMRAEGEGWRVPPNPLPPDTSPEDAAWILARRVPQPLGTFEQPVRLSGAVERLPRTYVYCLKPSPGDVFRQFRDRARGEAGWTPLEIDATHSPNVTAPDALARILAGIADRVAPPGA